MADNQERDHQENFLTKLRMYIAITRVARCLGCIPAIGGAVFHAEFAIFLTLADILQETGALIVDTPDWNLIIHMMQNRFTQLKRTYNCNNTRPLDLYRKCLDPTCRRHDRPQTASRQEENYTYPVVSTPARAEESLEANFGDESSIDRSETGIYVEIEHGSPEGPLTTHV